ncbi:MAG: PQQ-binding-like beta-propeller repeat protein [Verrucomicrobia bacterium]|nr:PQQ-binding-like beta-propeller repeat protein [Verrucomicrobiota bacterium]
MKTYVSFVLLGLALPPLSTAGDWLQFRGPDASGVAVGDVSGLPTTLNIQDNVAWELMLPGKGLSSPVVVGDKVFVTCSSGPDQKRLHVICFHSIDGKKLWERTFLASGRTMCHEKTAVAAPSPVSDGKNIYALFSSNDLFCLDLDGNLQWLRGLTQDYPNASNSLGLASSPVLVDKFFIAQIENDSESFVAGIDTTTGENVWKISRPKAANWTSPVIFEDGGKRLVGLQSSKGLLAVDPATGTEVWNFEGGASTIPSSGVGGGLIVVPSDGLTALKLNGGKPEQIWQEAQLRPGTGSPIIVGDRVFVVNNAGVLNCASLATGERLWRLRLKGPYGSSPVAAGNHLYFFDEEGGAQVVDISEPGEVEGKIVGEMDLGEMIQCTPAIGDGALFVRSNERLWKLTGTRAELPKP